MNHELRFCASLSVHRIDIDFIYQGLHEFPEKLNSNLRDALNRLDESKYDVILLNYGLCGNGTLRMTHPRLPMIMHNVHDCIPLIIGDGRRHSEYVSGKPGTYWYSCGWIEGFPLPGGPDYLEKYNYFYGRGIGGEMRDVIERMLMANYTHLTFIRWDELGEKISELGRRYTMECVRSLRERLALGVRYDEMKGDPDILQRFVDGAWNSGDFITIEPGQQLQFDPVKNVLCAV